MSFPEGRRDWGLIGMFLIQLIQLIIDQFFQDTDPNE